MTKIARDPNRVYSYCIYAWTYHNEFTYRHVNKKTETSLYRKKYCQVPFYSRVQARHIMTTLYGVDILKSVHLISGKQLREQGITTFPKQKFANYVILGDNPIKVNGRLRHQVPLKKYIYPQEFQYDKHRRRYFAILLKRHRKRGITHFNKWYKEQFYGYRQGISKEALHSKRKEVNDALLQEIPSLRSYSRWNRKGDI